MSTYLVIAYLLMVAVRLGLAGLNVAHRRRYGQEVPPEFAGALEPVTLRKSASYHAERDWLGLVQLLAVSAVILWFLFGGALRAYDQWVIRTVSSQLGEGVLFFVGLGLLSSLLELPFDVYATFGIEQRYGFNRTTPGLFVSDWVKGILLGAVLTALLAAAGIGLYLLCPTGYWVGFWAVAVGLTLLLMLIGPTVIEPLFIKTKPLENVELAQAVREMSERAGVTVSQVVQSDASRRSSHSNAYFSGIGRAKRVVLFDTLLERLTDEEVLAVLAHELGHWRLKHVSQRLFVYAGLGLGVFYGAAQTLASDRFAQSLGLSNASVFSRLVMIGVLLQLGLFVLTPLFTAWSRLHERQADAYARTLVGSGEALASALIKLVSDNLTNVHPHPLYARFYQGHPRTAERVQALRGATG